jgi:SSS family solute:Na+ symporter
MLGWISFGMSQIYAYGATGMWILPIPWFILCILIILLVPYFRKVSAISLPQAIGRRFGPGSRYLTALLSFFVFLSWTGAELVIVKSLAAPLLGLEGNAAIIAPLLFIIPIIIYTVLGGFRAIIKTDLIQFSIMAVFMLVLGGWAYSEASSAAPGGILEAVKGFTPPWAADKVALDFNFLGWIFPVALLIGYLPGWLIEQDLTLRIQAAPTTKQARFGAVVGFVLITVFIIAIPSFVAFMAMVVFPDAKEISSDYTGIISAFIAHMPSWLGVFMFLGLISCQMSTVDTFSNVTAMPLAYDLVEPLKLKENKKSVSMVSRSITAVSIILAFVYSWWADKLGDVYYISSGVLSASIAVPAIAIFWKRANTPGVIISSILGTVTTIGMYFWEYKYLQYADPKQPNYYTDVLPGWLAGGYGYLYVGSGVVIAVVSLIIISLVTKKPTDQQLSVVEDKPLDGPESIKEVS